MRIKLLDSTTKHRLSFIKFLFSEGMKQAEYDDPSCSISLLTFHDAIENFLLLCAEKFSVKMRKNENFMQFWENIEKTSGIQLQEPVLIDRLNRARNNLKHNGILPIRFHVIEFKEGTKRFFEKISKLILT